MLRKQTIKLKYMVDDEIVSISQSATSYIDNKYHQKTLKEIPSNNQNGNTYAVDFHGIRADWLMDKTPGCCSTNYIDELHVSDDGCRIPKQYFGLKFMKAMIREKRMDLFSTIYVKMMTSFLYEKYKRKIILFVLPFYIIHMVALIAHQILMELIETASKTPITTVEQQVYFERAELALNIVNGIIAFMVVMNSLLIFLSFWENKLRYFKRFWTIIDISIIALNAIIVVQCYFYKNMISSKDAHTIEAFLTILMWLKALYFMQLNEDIAPLIDSIFTVIKDIKTFIYVLLVGLAAYSNAFYIIG